MYDGGRLHARAPGDATPAEVECVEAVLRRARRKHAPGKKQASHVAGRDEDQRPASQPSVCTTVVIFDLDSSGRRQGECARGGAALSSRAAARGISCVLASAEP